MTLPFFYSYLNKLVIFTVIKTIWRDFKGMLQLVHPTSAPANILIPFTLPEKYLYFTPPISHPVQM